ncbi:MAG: YCF48-related protein, partial [bacterium]
GIGFKSGFEMPTGVGFQSGFTMPTGVGFQSGFTMPSGVGFQSGFVPPSNIQYESGFQQPSGWVPPSGWTPPPGWTGSPTTTNPGGSPSTTLPSQSWVNVTSNTSANLRGVASSTGSNVYAVGDGGVIISSANGSDWSALTSGVVTNLTDVKVQGPTVEVTGAGGLVRKTNNAGASWATIDVGAGATNLNAYMAGGNSQIAVGEGGMIRIAAGPSFSVWSSLASGSGQSLRNIAGAGGVAVVVGANGTIISLVGGSATSRTSGTDEDLNGVIFIGGTTTVFAVGDTGTILKSADAGANWVPISSGTSANLRGVFFTSVNVGYIVGDDGTILGTSNGGTSWVAETSNTSEDLYDIVPFGPYFYVVGNSGKIIRKSSMP